MYHILNLVSDLLYTEVIHFGKIILTVLTLYQGVSICELFFVQKISSPERSRILGVQKYCIIVTYFPQLLTSTTYWYFLYKQRVTQKLCG